MFMNSFNGRYFVKTRNIEPSAAWSVNASVWYGRSVSWVCLHLKNGGHVDLFIVRDVNEDRRALESLRSSLRGGRFSPEGNGWEYFMTDNALTQTLLRGGSETMCFGCHSAAKDLDFVFSADLLNP